MFKVDAIRDAKHQNNHGLKKPMNADRIVSLARATLNGSMPFPEIVANLIAEDVEYYHVDYAACTLTFYGTSGSTVSAPLLFEELPPISREFDATALKAAILDSQQHGQDFRAFCQRAMCAGVCGYFAFLRGQRVVYIGRQGNQHTEWFPGDRPEGA